MRSALRRLELFDTVGPVNALLTLAVAREARGGACGLPVCKAQVLLSLKYSRLKYSRPKYCGGLCLKYSARPVASAPRLRSRLPGASGRTCLALPLLVAAIRASLEVCQALG